ncbi:hypothetical protein NPIL_102061 [Nephila pilipes]|uniref:Uncharacterized protein n=1 Tax=Nephila pilipes TaxID=299642 RepID=A0A8X6QF70_NEPPI|nr:hypothetical protein NPIL_102061 [Nephila pilipes]
MSINQTRYIPNTEKSTIKAADKLISASIARHEHYVPHRLPVFICPFQGAAAPAFTGKLTHVNTTLSIRIPKNEDIDGYDCFRLHSGLARSERFEITVLRNLSECLENYTNGEPQELEIPESLSIKIVWYSAYTAIDHTIHFR